MESKKKCSKCKIEKTLDNFHKGKNGKFGVKSSCKICIGEYGKKYNIENNQKIKEKQKAFRDKNKKKSKQRYQEKKPQYSNYYQNNKEKIRKYQKEYSHRTRKERNNYAKIRSKTLPHVKVRKMMGGMINNMYFYAKEGKIGKTLDLLGYTVERFKTRIEYQFTDKMNWSNYGSYWEIDHIKPIDRFIKQGETRAHIINALSNLRPLSVSENRSKGNTF